jgi:hypothetical protein
MSLLSNDRQNRLFLPNLFVLGAAKCATSTLHVYLGRMDDVCMSKPKEPFFFEAEFEKGLDYYRQAYFSHWRGERIIGESRHRNLYLPFVPERIKGINPNAKLIVLVRNPIDRAFSHWFHNFSRNSENLDFAHAIQADWQRIESGLQYESEEEIEKHKLHLIPRSPGGEIGLGLYRTYNRNLTYSYRLYRIFQRFIENTRLIPLPAKRARRLIVDNLLPKPSLMKIDLETKYWLEGHYQWHNQKLQEYLNQDLSCWGW